MPARARACGSSLIARSLLVCRLLVQLCRSAGGDRGYFEENDPVSRDGGGIPVGRDWHILMFPEVARMQALCADHSAKLQVFPSHANVRWLISAVEETDRRRVLDAEAGSLTVPKRPDPYFSFALSLHSPNCLHVPILVDRDRLTIHENRFRLFGHGAQVIAGHQWRCQEAP